MKKFATIAALALAAQQANAACAPGDTWAASLGMTTVAATGVKPTDYCTRLKAPATLDVCCSAADITKIKTDADALITSLSTKVGERDKQLIDGRGELLEINETLIKIVQLLTDNASKVSSLPTGIQTFITGHQTLITEFVTDMTDLKKNFLLMQTSRQKCINAAIQSQAALKCLACSGDLDTPATSGLTTGTFVWDTVPETALRTACHEYLTYSVEQSRIIKLNAVNSLYTTFLSGLEKAVAGDSTYTTDFTAFIEAYNKLTYGADSYDFPIDALAATCDATSCAYITTTLFANGVLNVENLARGGTASADVVDLATSRRLDEEIPAGRRLTYNFDHTTAAGFTVDFPLNPGEVDNDANSAVRNGVVACALTALVALF